MVPFRVYDNSEKKVWIVLNYHPGTDGGGEYLVAQEEDGNDDGFMRTISAQELSKFRLVDFLDDSSQEGY